MIVCLRTVAVPAERRDDYLPWIRDGRAATRLTGSSPSSCSSRLRRQGNRRDHDLAER